MCFGLVFARLNICLGMAYFAGFTQGMLSEEGKKCSENSECHKNSPDDPLPLSFPEGGEETDEISET